MNTMTDETYNGYANRETWAFNLHWQNDQGLYQDVLEYAADVMADLDNAGNDLDRGEGYGSSVTDYGLGEKIVNYLEERTDLNYWQNDVGVPMPEPFWLMREDVGSFWRIDRAEVGAAVRESLEVES